MKKIFQIALYSALALQFVPVWASSVNVSASLSTDTLSAGQAAIMTIRFEIPDPWHIYALSDSGKDGTETKLALSLPEGFSSRLEKSQSPIKFKFFGSECDGYKNSAVFSYLICAPKKISADSSGCQVRVVYRCPEPVFYPFPVSSYVVFVGDVAYTERYLVHVLVTYQVGSRTGSRPFLEYVVDTCGDSSGCIGNAGSGICRDCHGRGRFH